MSHKNKNLLKDELIGLNIEIIESKNKDNLKIKGKIIDETKFTITILQKNKQKKLMKKNIKIKVKYRGQDHIIDCEKIQKRPEERLKIR